MGGIELYSFCLELSLYRRWEPHRLPHRRVIRPLIQLSHTPGKNRILKLFEAKGESISLQEGDGKSVDVVAIRSASHEQEKR